MGGSMVYGWNNVYKEPENKLKINGKIRCDISINPPDFIIFDASQKARVLQD